MTCNWIVRSWGPPAVCATCTCGFYILWDATELERRKVRIIQDVLDQVEAEHAQLVARSEQRRADARGKDETFY